MQHHVAGTSMTRDQNFGQTVTTPPGRAASWLLGAQAEAATVRRDHILAVHKDKCTHGPICRIGVIIHRNGFGQLGSKRRQDEGKGRKRVPWDGDARHGETVNHGLPGGRCGHAFERVCLDEVGDQAEAGGRLVVDRIIPSPRRSTRPARASGARATRRPWIASSRTRSSATRQANRPRARPMRPGRGRAPSCRPRRGPG